MTERDVPALDEATRPAAPADDVPGSEVERMVGRHLVEVHDMYRAELDQVREVLDRLRTGHTSVAAARGDLQRVALIANNWAFGGVCQRYCFALTQHHELESGQIFGHLRRSDPRLGDVLDRLQDEHDVIHHAIVRVDEALVRLAAEPDDLAPVEEAVEVLAAIVTSHFTYEERELVGPLGRWGFYAGQL